MFIEGIIDMEHFPSAPLSCAQVTSAQGLPWHAPLMPMGSKCHTGSINTHFLDHALAAQLGSLVLPCENFNMILFKLFKIQNDQTH